MADMYVGQQYTIAEISEHLDRPQSTVISTLDNFGVPRRPRGRRAGTLAKVTMLELKRTAFMYEELRWSINEIAEATGLAYNSVRWRLDRAGVKMRAQDEGIRLRFARRKKATSDASRAAARKNLQRANTARAEQRAQG